MSPTGQSTLGFCFLSKSFRFRVQIIQQRIPVKKLNSAVIKLKYKNIHPQRVLTCPPFMLTSVMASFASLEFIIMVGLTAMVGLL